MSTLNELSHRRETIQARLKELATTLPTAKKPTLPETTTTHWSFVLKELQWLATDYASERQRHQTARRKLKPSIPQIGNYGIPIRDEIEFEITLYEA